MIENLCCDLRRAEDQRDLDRAAVLLANVLTAFGTAASSEKVQKMRAQAYLLALEDLPAWAIEEACHRWLRGEAGDFNYSFAPSPPQLRTVAIAQRDKRVHLRKALERLLTAEPEREYTKEYRGEMLLRLADLFRGVGASLTRNPKTAE
jgi:hypothetical protein